MRRAFRLTSAFLAAVVLASSAFAKEYPKPGQLPTAPPSNGEGMNVLILGDSLALCGFGKRLDELFRNDPQVKATYTYMACGTNPLSWLKQKPYTSIKAQCGYWCIESDSAGKHPREMQDTYGMGHNQAPKPHPVPKLEDLLEAVHPDILVVQTGSNLFGLFPDAKTVRPAQHAASLRNYLAPFKSKAISPPSTLRKIYWVGPPTSGRVAKEVQEFVFEQTRAELSPPSVIIDSRSLVTYPYHHMDADKEHFIGEDMTTWADKVFEIIERDLGAQPLASVPLLSDSQPQRAIPVAQPPNESNPPTAPSPPPVVVEKAQPVIVKAKLVFQSRPMTVQELMPYQESLVGYVYEVEKVVRGNYPEKEILVMHPAHIGLKPQRLDKFRIGKSYKLRLHPLEDTLWSTAKARDESGQINLQPYIRIEDLKRHPQEHAR